MPALWQQSLPCSGQALCSSCGPAAVSGAFLLWHKVNLLITCCSPSSLLLQTAQRDWDPASLAPRAISLQLRILWIWKMPLLLQQNVTLKPGVQNCLLCFRLCKGPQFHLNYFLQFNQNLHILLLGAHRSWAEPIPGFSCRCSLPVSSNPIFSQHPPANAGLKLQTP